VKSGGKEGYVRKKRKLWFICRFFVSCADRLQGPFNRLLSVLSGHQIFVCEEEKAKSHCGTKPAMQRCQLRKRASAILPSTKLVKNAVDFVSLSGRVLSCLCSAGFVSGVCKLSTTLRFSSSYKKDFAKLVISKNEPIEPI